MKKQLLTFGLMAGMGVFVLSQSFANDIKATDTLTANITDTASFYRDTVSMKNDTASFVRDTASFTRDTASFVRDTALLKDTATFVFKADTATFKVADTATAFKSDTAAFKADTAMANDTASFAAHLNAATGDTAAMKAIKDTASFKQDTAKVLGKNIVSFSKDTTTPQPTDTSKAPKAQALKAKD